jgi:UrcA family protein
MAKLSFLLLTAPMAFVGATVPAAAEDNGERRTVVVSYNDLNLASVDDRARLTKRVKSAVRVVCGSRSGPWQGLRDRTQSLRCERATMADADIKLAGLLNGNGTRLADRGRIFVAAP